MDTMIYKPAEEFESLHSSRHAALVKAYLDDLVKRSGVDIAENRKTVQEYHALKENLKKRKKQLNFWRVLRVIMIVTLLTLPLVFWKVTPKIKRMRNDIQQADQKAAALLELAKKQMAPLCALFSDRDALNLIEQTLPLFSFAPNFSTEQEADMCANYDFKASEDPERSAVDLLSGRFNQNPFLLTVDLVHRMGEATYHGSKVIHWTETYRDSDGNLCTRSRSQTLHASITRPKPFYSSQTVLHYCAQSGPELSFSRNATHLEQKSEKEIERYVKKGEKKLKKMTDRAIRKNQDFVNMSNTDFEVLFHALDRTNEVQFRSLFTPLAQTNMVDLLLSKDGYGDDFSFVKKNRTNEIIAQHSQNRPISLYASAYFSYAYDELEEKFTNLNRDYFKSLYFAFAPLWSIPSYQMQPIHTLEPIAPQGQKYSTTEYEVLVSRVASEWVVHPQTKTPAIRKCRFDTDENGIDRIFTTAFSYDIIPCIAFVPVYGDDGCMHDVPVPWDQYLPLEQTTTFFVASSELAQGHSVLAQRNGVCIFE